MNRAPVAQISLGGWNVYFLGKLALYWQGFIGFQPLENLAFAALLLLPLQSQRWQRVRTMAAIPAAIGLLYHDSWLPPVSRVFSQASLLAQFDLAYLVELTGRFINVQMAALLIIIAVAYRLLSQWVRVGVLVLAVMVALLFTHTRASVNPLQGMAVAGNANMPPQAAAKPQSLDDVAHDFFASEAKRRVAFSVPAANATPFDIIFVHICSLSWDDLRAVGLDSHPLWKHLDITLTHFNSAASYSGPAVIRMLRAPCGQPRHEALYSPAPEGCYLMEDLRQAGFESNLALNHDGHFEDFLKLVQQQRINQTPLSLDNIPVTQHAFDDSPIFDDFAVLSRWLQDRKKDHAARAALFYNTISLHDGNKTNGAGMGRNSHDTYKARLERLLDDLDHFMGVLETSGTKAVVVLIPEHGAAYRGDRMQIAGLREIPSPAITLVPVGIKVVGSGVRRAGEPAVVAESTSYLALSRIVANLLKKSPFSGDGFNAGDYLADLPVTPLLSQNGEVTMMHYNNQYYLRQENNGPWTPYDPGGP